jgi:hypothetical protein
VFTGTASNTDARFSGAVTIRVRDQYDNTSGAGSLKGDLDIAGSSTPPGNFHGHFDAVLIGSTAQGWLEGHLGDGSHFMGSFSSSFSTATGFTNFTIGSGSATNTAIAWTGHCEGPKPNPPHTDNGPNHPPHPNGPKPDDHHHHHDH